MNRYFFILFFTNSPLFPDVKNNLVVGRSFVRIESLKCARNFLLGNNFSLGEFFEGH